MRKELKDKSVFRMLQTERDRCVLVVEKISAELEKLPRGSLGQRKVKSGGNEYVYPCLKYREGPHVKSVHVTHNKIEEIQAALETRRKLQNILEANEKRIKTINQIIREA